MGMVGHNVVGDKKQGGTWFGGVDGHVESMHGLVGDMPMVGA
jgi:hypothetical protein